MVETIFIQLSLMAIIAFALAFIVRTLRQPIIIGYIIAGIILGPKFFNILHETDTLAGFAHIGVALLLFIVGLELHPKIIKTTGKVAFFAALAQLTCTFAVSFVAAQLLKFDMLSSVFIALALSLSSTIIVMKIITDKGENATLHGRIIASILIINDIVAILVLMFISSESANMSIATVISSIVVKGALLTVGILLFSYLSLPKATEVFAKSQELLLLFSLSWALALSGLYTYFGFPPEIGALIAGMTLTLTTYKYEISSRIKPIRDFFIVLFFVTLGSQMIFTNVLEHLLPIIVFTLIIILIKPLAIIASINLLNYTSRTSFLTGSSLAQISEFSFIILSIGAAYRIISPELISIITISGLIGIVFSTYAMSHANKAYNLFSPLLKRFERKSFYKIDEGKFHLEEDYNVILFGHNRIGQDLMNSFKKIKERFLVVDYNPETINSLMRRGISCRYGDAGDSELIDELNLKEPQMFISTIPDLDINMLLINKIRTVNKNAIIIVVAHQINDALKFYKHGATYVIMPHFLGGKHTSYLIEKNGLSSAKFEKEKDEHILELKARKQDGQEHPLHERD